MTAQQMIMPVMPNPLDVDVIVPIRLMASPIIASGIFSQLIQPTCGMMVSSAQACSYACNESYYAYDVITVSPVDGFVGMSSHFIDSCIMVCKVYES
jgi:L-serine deaminase